jgi:hypothetical protein
MAEAGGSSSVAPAIERSKECQNGGLPKTGKSCADQKSLDRLVVGQPTQRFSRERPQNQLLAVKYARREWPFAEPWSGQLFVPLKTGLPDLAGCEFRASSWAVSENSKVIWKSTEVDFGRHLRSRKPTTTEQEQEEHNEHASQVSIWMFDPQEANSDGRRLAISLL